MNRRDIKDFISPEIAAWPGASFVLDFKRPHPRIVLRFRNRSRFVVTASTGSDRRGAMNMLARVRRELAGLGATRTEGL